MLSFLLPILLAGQKAETIHIAQPEETLYGISRIHGISVDELLNNNPYLRIGLLEVGDTLLITSGDEIELVETPPPFDVDFDDGNRHIVKEKETIYSLSKRYNIPVRSILAYNPNIDSDVIHVSDTLSIPLNLLIGDSQGQENEMSDNSFEANFIHVVDQGETLYGISKRYEVPIEKLIQYNRRLNRKVLNIGDTLFVNRDTDVIAIFPKDKKENIVSTPTKVQETVSDFHVGEDEFSRAVNTYHTVVSGETLYRISKKYNVTVDEIKFWNNLTSNSIHPDQLLITGIQYVDSFPNGPSENTPTFEVEIESTKSNNEVVTTESSTSKTYEPGTTYPNSSTEITESENTDSGDGLTIFDRLNYDNDKSSNTIIAENASPVNESELTAFDQPDYNSLESKYPSNTRTNTNTSANTSINTSTNINTNTSTNIPGFAPGENPSDFVIVDGKKMLKSDFKMTVKKETYYALTDTTVYQNPIRIEDRPVIVEENIVEGEGETKEENQSVYHKIDYSKLSPIYHKINDGETLESIGSLKNQKVEALLVWNKIGNSDPLPKEMIVGWFIPKKDNETTAVSPVVHVNSAEKGFRDGYNKRNKNQLAYKRIKGRSKGSWLKDNSAFEKNFYALHRDAPNKSYLRVVNPMNNKSVYVKVIGKLPDVGENADVDLKLTSAAVKKLGLRDDKFVVDWSYHIEK